MLTTRSWRIDCGPSPLEVTVGLGVGDEASEHETVSHIVYLLWAAENGNRPEMREVRRLHEALVGRWRDFPTEPATYRVMYRSLWERVRYDIDQAVLTGRLRITKAEAPSVRVRQVAEEIAPHMRPAPLESRLTFFEVRFVDEIGEPIPGLDVVFSFEGRSADQTTDADGVVRLEDVEASFASIRVKSRTALANILEPRWSQTRSGDPVSEGPSLRFLQLGEEDWGSIGLESRNRRTIVVQPPSFVEIALVDELEEPVAGERYLLRLPGGRLRSGTLDDAGRARVIGIPLGRCELSFPDLDGADWQPLSAGSEAT